MEYSQIYQGGFAMVEEVKEVKEILEHIAQNHHFLLSGGAGSGKTYTMVQVIRAVLNAYPGANIACMTYTNAAATEIEHRINDSRLSVSTIHDFLWNNIQNYQKELKNAIIECSRGDEAKIKSKEYPEGLPDNFFDDREEKVVVQYKEYVKLTDGIISHDEVLAVSEYMFDHSDRLVDIVKSRYRFIFIDEYQDTHEEVVNILLEFFQRTTKVCTIGFFGDSMQAIYDTGIGDIESYIHREENPDGIVYEVQKPMNRRCPRSVIKLVNKLRNDGLEQEPIETNVEGTCRFFFSASNDESKLKTLLKNDGWDFDSKETKELRLTHNLISAEAGFKTLLEIHNVDPILGYRDKVDKHIRELGWDCSGLTFGKVLARLEADNKEEIRKWSPTPGQQTFIDENRKWFDYAKNLDYQAFLKCFTTKEQLIDDTDDDTEKKSVAGSNLSPLIKHLFRIEEALRLYAGRKYNDFIKKTSFKSISRFEQKKELKQAIDEIVGLDTNVKIGKVIDLADEMELCVIDDKLNTYKEKNEYIYRRVLDVDYTEVRNVYDYILQQQPFSTQHKSKGLEFNNVLVLLDNGKWSKYNFASLFTETKTNKNVILRTRKLFYVCCTRAKKNLAVFYPAPSADIVESAKSLFGEQNVIDLDSYNVGKDG